MAFAHQEQHVTLYPNLFCHCGGCLVLGFAMQLHSMLFTFVHLFVILVVQEYVIFENNVTLVSGEFVSCAADP